MKKNRVAETFDLHAAFAAKMQESSIEKDAVRKLGFVQKEHAPAGTPFDEPGILIPYYNMQGSKTKFWRYRYLRQPPKTGFAKLANTKPLRYVQPKGSLNELYLPPVVDWNEVAEEQLRPILITEGEFKAACACIHTPYPCIGLGGVWSWRAGKRRLEMLPGFEEFKWEQRPVYIVYDSDAVTNPDVMQAENALAKALTELGAEPHVVRLPMDDKAKVGLDDYIVKRGADALDVLLEAAEPWVAAKELHRLNEEVVYVRDPGLVMRLDTMQRMSARAFTDHAFSTRWYMEEIVSKQGVKKIKKSAAREWIGWPSRAEVPRVTYAPGEPKVTDSRELNIWPGWGCEPVEGDIAPWKELLDHLFAGQPEARTWFEEWCAYPLQHPGIKMYSSAVLWGLRHGTGKSLVGYTLFKIYGRNATEVGDEELRATHNEWAENKQFVMGDEITSGDKRGMADRLKSMITRQQLRLNPKYVPAYTVPDVINYYFTSNHPDSFFIEDDDRRFFIHEVRRPPLPEDWCLRWEKWAGARDTVGPGLPALFHHLLTMPITTFNPNARAMMTPSKQAMMEAGRSDLATWVAQLKDDPDSVLRVGGKVAPYVLWRADDLLTLYENGRNTRVTGNGMARELSRQGFLRACGGLPVRTKDGSLRLWAVRKVPAAVDIGRPPDVGHFYDKERGTPAAKRSKGKHEQ